MLALLFITEHVAKKGTIIDEIKPKQTGVPPTGLMFSDTRKLRRSVPLNLFHDSLHPQIS